MTTRPLIDPHSSYTASVLFDAEGSQIAVTTCTLCGAAVLLEPQEKGRDWIATHTAFHRLISGLARTANPPMSRLRAR